MSEKIRIAEIEAVVVEPAQPLIQLIKMYRKKILTVINALEGEYQSDLIAFYVQFKEGQRYGDLDEQCSAAMYSIQLLDSYMRDISVGDLQPWVAQAIRELIEAQRLTEELLTAENHDQYRGREIL